MTALIERITPSKLGEITIPLRRNLDALFFDIATQDLNFQRGKVLAPDLHGAISWKRWIFCPTDHLDFENLENRRRYHNPGKPRTAGLCGREVVASDHLPPTKPRNAGLCGIMVPTSVFEVSLFQRGGGIARCYGPKRFRRFSPTS